MMKYALVIVGLGMLAVTVFEPEADGQIDVSKIRIDIPNIEKEVTGPNGRFPMVYGDYTDNGGRKTIWRNDAVGKQVIVEGIAWGQPFGKKGEEGTISPWAGPHVIYDGSSIFVKGLDFTETKARGKTVRVVGTLKLNPIVHIRWGDLQPYFYIQADSFEVIDAVTDPVLKLADAKSKEEAQKK